MEKDFALIARTRNLRDSLNAASRASNAPDQGGRNLKAPRRK
jgi:hypothetical protein